MALRLSRRKLAEFAAEKLLSGVTSQDALIPVAAYLVETRRTHEYELIVRDIEEVLAEHGHVVADVTTAHPFDDTTRKEIEKLIGATSIEYRETVDPSVIGGIDLAVPGKRFDGTVTRKLKALKQL
jgi:F0F1-type ATP synthase delta subunit